MSRHTETITVHMALSEYGDAVIYGSTVMRGYVSGTYLKHRLFAWHEVSFYGTKLTVQAVQDMEVVILPSEQVIPFFADGRLLEHIEWVWDEACLPFVELAPSLANCIQDKKYAPSLSAFKSGKLQWVWDAEAFTPEELNRISLLHEDEIWDEGLRATFSATVQDQCYGSEEAAADLRREYPLLFSQNRTAAEGMDDKQWLIAIGWRPDTAPFRPLLQLLEPDEEAPEWRLKLVLQDKQDAAGLAAVRLVEDGQAFGSWPETWTAHIKERSPGWLQGLQAALPARVLHAPEDDVLGKPLSDEAAWQFLTVDSQRLLQSGWLVLLPAWWEAASRKKPKLRAKVRSGEGENAERSSGGSLFGLDALVNFDWRIAIGEATLSEDEFAELVARNERLVRFRGQWIPLDPALVAQIRQMMAGVDREDGLSFQDILHLHLLGNSDETEPPPQNGEEAQ
ncbi:SNF2 helicase-associated domain-containing protein, partial [Paenibacillus glucanolyticus]